MNNMDKFYIGEVMDDMKEFTLDNLEVIVDGLNKNTDYIVAIRNGELHNESERHLDDMLVISPERTSILNREQHITTPEKNVIMNLNWLQYPNYASKAIFDKYMAIIETNKNRKFTYTFQYDDRHFASVLLDRVLTQEELDFLNSLPILGYYRFNDQRVFLCQEDMLMNALTGWISLKDFNYGYIVRADPYTISMTRMADGRFIFTGDNITVHDPISKTYTQYASGQFLMRYDITLPNGKILRMNPGFYSTEPEVAKIIDYTTGETEILSSFVPYPINGILINENELLYIQMNTNRIVNNSGYPNKLLKVKIYNFLTKETTTFSQDLHIFMYIRRYFRSMVLLPNGNVFVTGSDGFFLILDPKALQINLIGVTLEHRYKKDIIRINDNYAFMLIEDITNAIYEYSTNMVYPLLNGLPFFNDFSDSFEKVFFINDTTILCPPNYGNLMWLYITLNPNDMKESLIEYVYTPNLPDNGGYNHHGSFLSPDKKYVYIMSDLNDVTLEKFDIENRVILHDQSIVIAPNDWYWGAFISNTQLFLFSLTDWVVVNVETNTIEFRYENFVYWDITDQYGESGWEADILTGLYLEDVRKYCVIPDYSAILLLIDLNSPSYEYKAYRIPPQPNDASRTFSGAIYANGLVFLAPYWRYGNVIIFNPVTEEFIDMGDDTEVNTSNALMVNGKIWMMPLYLSRTHDSQDGKIVIIDPITLEFEVRWLPVRDFYLTYVRYLNETTLIAQTDDNNHQIIDITNLDNITITPTKYPLAPALVPFNVYPDTNGNIHGYYNYRNSENPSFMFKCDQYMQLDADIINSPFIINENSA